MARWYGFLVHRQARPILQLFAFFAFWDKFSRFFDRFFDRFFWKVFWPDFLTILKIFFWSVWKIFWNILWTDYNLTYFFESVSTSTKFENFSKLNQCLPWPMTIRYLSLKCIFLVEPFSRALWKKNLKKRTLLTSTF